MPTTHILKQHTNALHYNLLRIQKGISNSYSVLERTQV